MAKKNKGAGFSRNYALKKSNSPFVAFMNSDDLWKKDKLKKQLNFMKKNNFSFTYTNYETFGKKSKKIYNPSRLNYSDFIKNTSIPTSTMMVKREKLKILNLVTLKFVKITILSVNF